MDTDVPSYQILETVAQKEGVSPSELSPPLFTAVDPDALDALFLAETGSNTAAVEIEFTYLDYLVQIRNGPRMSVTVQDGDG